MSAVQVVVVEPVGGYGGMDFWDRSLCVALADADWRPLLLTSEAMRIPGDSYDAWEVYRGVFGSDPHWRRGLRYVSATVRGLWRARQLGVRIAHVHVFHVGVLQYLSVVMARLMGMRIVLSAHDVGSFRAGESSRLLRRIYRASDAILVYSQQGRRALLDAFGIPERKIYVVPHGNYVGFLPSLPEAAQAKTSFGYDESDIVLLFFGQIKRVKRLDLLLQATALARKRGADRVRLLVAGSAADSDMASISGLIADEGLDDIVQLDVRYIPNDELPRYFAAADMAVLPYDNIYQSGVVLLAMSNSVPVMTSDIPGMREVIEHSVTGLMFRNGDVTDLADRIHDVQQGKWILSQLTSAAYDFVSTRHSWDNCAAITIDAYRAVSNGCPSLSDKSVPLGSGGEN